MVMAAANDMQKCFHLAMLPRHRVSRIAWMSRSGEAAVAAEGAATLATTAAPTLGSGAAPRGAQATIAGNPGRNAGKPHGAACALFALGAKRVNLNAFQSRRVRCAKSVSLESAIRSRGGARRRTEPTPGTTLLPIRPAILQPSCRVTAPARLATLFPMSMKLRRTLRRQRTDWDGDGIKDLLYRNRETGVVFVWYMTASGALGGSDYVTQIDPSTYRSVPTSKERWASMS